MKLKDVPQYPAYLVFHDAYMNGAMDVYPYNDLAVAKAAAHIRNERLEEMGQEECGLWAAYEKLPRRKIWKFHGETK